MAEQSIAAPLSTIQQIRVAVQLILKAMQLLADLFFVGNSSVSNGGAIAIEGAEANIINNTIYNNQSNFGGGISTLNSSSSIVNTILWQNLAFSSGGQVYHSGSGDPVYEYCDVQGGVSGTGNINEDPVFLDPELMLFDLIEGSPCIDAGSPDLDGDGVQWMADTDDQDLDGTRMDIGAFTYLGPDTIPPTVDIITPNGGESFGTGETVAFEWNADDDRVINWTRHLSPIMGDRNICRLIALVVTRGLLWDVPENLITSEGALRVIVSDWGDNLASDESDGFFSIVDIIDPTITLDSPEVIFQFLSMNQSQYHGLHQIISELTPYRSILIMVQGVFNIYYLFPALRMKPVLKYPWV